MAVKVGINGFGRIGRLTLRAIVESGRKDVELVALNATGDIETNAHLLRYDSSHGRFPNEVIVDGDTMDFGLGPIKVTNTRNPADLDWSDVDVALECTGAFKDTAKCQAYLDAGAKKVLISAPAKAEHDRTVVYGVNHDQLTADDIVVSNASCTTNCLAPTVHVLDKEIGIETGFMTTIHSYTLDQHTLDTKHKDLYRARAAAMSMIPTSTGAAKAVGLVLPHMQGKIDGVAMRVPTPNVSVVDFNFIAKRETSVEEINAAAKKASETYMKGILGYTGEKLVSVDFNHDIHSAIFHADQTKVQAGTMCRVLAWYDNEWGFSNRMLDTAAVMGTL